MSLPGLVCLLIMLVAIERFGLWAGRRSWLPWRRANRPELSAAGLDEFAASFQSGKRVELNQRNTELMLRDDAADGAPPYIDLDAGTATLPRPTQN